MICKMTMTMIKMSNDTYDEGDDDVSNADDIDDDDHSPPSSVITTTVEAGPRPSGFITCMLT